MYLYLAQFENKRPPECLDSCSYVYIKGRSDGLETVVATFSENLDSCCQALTKEDAKALLNAWVDIENTPPVPKDLDGNDITQTYVNIDLETFEQLLKEIADVQRIQRGYLKDGERSVFDSIESLKKSYPNYTKDMTGVELDMLLRTTRAFAGGE